MAANTKKPVGKKSEKAWRDAIMVAVNSKIEDAAGKPTRALTVIAHKVVKEASNGNMAAIAEIGNRLDGKSHQTTEKHVTNDTTITHKQEPVSETARWLADITARDTKTQSKTTRH